MPNPLFNQPQQQPMMNQNGSNFFAQLQQFSNMVKGDPQQLVQNLLSSGRMTQEQFQQYSQMANQILGRR